MWLKKKKGKRVCYKCRTSDVVGTHAASNSSADWVLVSFKAAITAIVFIANLPLCCYNIPLWRKTRQVGEVNPTKTKLNFTFSLVELCRSPFSSFFSTCNPYKYTNVPICLRLLQCSSYTHLCNSLRLEYQVNTEEGKLSYDAFTCFQKY